MVDITKFLIISTEQFESIITHFNCNLTINDQSYLITYLFTNFLAYVIIFLSIKIVLWIYYSFFSKKGSIL